jgi:hypothetical protein
VKLQLVKMQSMKLQSVKLNSLKFPCIFSYHVNLFVSLHVVEQSERLAAVAAFVGSHPAVDDHVTTQLLVLLEA